MFDPAVAAILAHHESKSGHAMMRAAATRAQELGYVPIPPAKGDGKYLRLVLRGSGSRSATLYLDGSRVSAGAKGLREFALTLPGAVTTASNVQFPLGTVDLAALEAFAHWVGKAEPGNATEASPSGASAVQPVPGLPPHTEMRSRDEQAAPPTAVTAAPSPPTFVTAPQSAASPPPPAFPGAESLPVTARRLRSPQVLTVAVAALVVLLGALLVGVGGALVLSGLVVLGVGVVAAVRGQVGWARITSRRVGGAAIAGGLVIFIVGGALLPTQQPTQDDTSAPADASDEAAGPLSTEAELDIAAAEEALALAETDERAVAPDALVKNPSSGALTDEAAGAAVDAAAPTSALAALAALEVRGRAPKTGYDRDLFGSGWGDPDRNGCDTRNDMLSRDLIDDEFKPGTRNCVVVSGALADPYSGRAIAFQRGQRTSEAVQIDHVVAVSDAWQKGAQAWNAERRRAFYNDPLNLLAVDGPLNLQKGDGDAATWLPPNRAYRCPYVARQVAVKLSYSLWVTQAEKNAMATILGACPDEPLPGGVVAAIPGTPPPPSPAPPVAPPAPVPTPAPAPAPAPRTVIPAPVPAPPPAPAPQPFIPAPAPAPAPVPAPAPPPAPVPAPAPGAYYQNCDAVRAAGAAPITPGDPGWQQKFDADDDGIGCE